MKLSQLRIAPIMAVAALLGVSCTGEEKVGDENKSSGEKTEDIKVEVTTADASDIDHCSATLNATCSITNAKDVQGVAVFYYGTLDVLDNIKVNGNKVVVDMISENTKSFSKEISGLEPLTKYYYVAYITINEKEYSGTVKSFTTRECKENGYEFVDLGLSVKWATCNVGATKPEDFGDYYAWGETEPYYEVGYAQESPQAHWKDGYSAGYVWSNYKWCNGSSSTLTKYNPSSSYGTIDNKTVLDPEDDVAHVKWGGSWRMPTNAEQVELLNSCTWTWYSSGNSEFNGVAGYKVTSNKSGYTDRSIFLPAAGFRLDTSLYSAGELGGYWSSSLSTDSPYLAQGLNFHSDDHFTTYNFRSRGRSARPVCP